MDDLGAEMFGLAASAPSARDPGWRLRSPGILNLGGDGELAAGLMPLTSTLDMARAA